MNPSSPERVWEHVQAAARRAAPRAEVSLSMVDGRAANTRYARNEITSSGEIRRTQAQLEVALGRRRATLSTNQTDPDALRAAVDRCVQMARLSPEDPERMPLLGPQSYGPSAPAHDPRTAALSGEARARTCAAAIAGADAARLSAAGFHQTDATSTWLRNSAGLSASHRATWVKFTCTARDEAALGSGWAGEFAHRVDELDCEALSRAAIDKAIRSRRPRALAPGRYTVVLEPAAVAELLTALTDSLDARDAAEGRSFFARPGGGARLGEQLLSERITLKTDPADPALPYPPFDREGQPVRPTSWFDRGRLAALVTSRYWAAKTGTRPTGEPPGWHLVGGADSVESLVAGVERGLLVTRIWYTQWLDRRALRVTGVTRDGLFLIENGEVSAPLQNFRLNQSVIDVFRNADAVGSRTVRLPLADGQLRVPALRTHDFHMAAVSTSV